MRRPLLLLLLVVWVARPSAADKWTYAASEHFEVYSTGGARTAREALTYFERVHAFFAERLTLRTGSKTPTRLIVFSNEQQFAPYRPNEGVAAYYLGGPDRDYIVMARLDEDSNPIVVHEYAHLMFRHAGANYPLWLNEGLAEFYSTMTMDGDRMLVGPVPPGRLQYLNSGVRLIELDRLFAIDHDSPEYNTRQHAGVFYSQSWALAHMIMATDRYAPLSDTFLKTVSTLLATGNKETASTEAFQQVYGKSAADVMGDLTNYITRGQYLGYTPKFTPPKRPNYSTRDVDPFEADLMTANLLANSRNDEQAAREAFVRLEAQKASDLGLLESRAYFELRHGHRDVAAGYLSRAADAGTRNVKVYTDLVALRPADAEAVLSKAIALLPQDIDLRIAHATYLLNERKGTQAVLTLQALKQITDDKAYRVFSLTANGFLLLNQFDDARALAKRARLYAREGAESQSVGQLLKNIDDFAENQVSLERRREELGAAASGAPVSDVSFSDESAIGGDRPPQPAPAPAPSAQASDAELPLTKGPTIDTAATSRIRGRIRNIVCTGKALVLQLFTGKDMLRLVIVDPATISVIGPKNGTVSLACGQQDFPLTVTYLPVADKAYNTVGRVLVMDYRDGQ